MGRRRPYGRDALVDFSAQYAPEADPYFVQDRKQHFFLVTLKLNRGFEVWSVVLKMQCPGTCKKCRSVGDAVDLNQELG